MANTTNTAGTNEDRSSQRRRERKPSGEGGRGGAQNGGRYSDRGQAKRSGQQKGAQPEGKNGRPKPEGKNVGRPQPGPKAQSKNGGQLAKGKEVTQPAAVVPTTEEKKVAPNEKNGQKKEGNYRGRRSGRGRKTPPVPNAADTLITEKKTEPKTEVSIPKEDQLSKMLPSPVDAEEVAPQNLALAVAVEALLEEPSPTQAEAAEEEDEDKDIVQPKKSTSSKKDKAPSQLKNQPEDVVRPPSPPVIDLDTAVSFTEAFDFKPSAEHIETNAYLSILTKKIRATKKKLTKIATLENKAPEELNEDQTELLKSRERLEHNLVDLETLKIQFTEIAEAHYTSLAVSQAQTATIPLAPPPPPPSSSAEEQPKYEAASTARRGRRGGQNRSNNKQAAQQQRSVDRLLKLLLVVARADKGTLPSHIDSFGKALLGFGKQGPTLSFDAAFEHSCKEAAKYLDAATDEIEPGITYRDLQAAIDKEAAHLTTPAAFE